MSGSNPIKYIVAGVAAVVIAFAAYAIGNSNSGNGTSGVANASQPGAANAAPGNGQFPGNGGPPQGGQAPPGFGTPATGAAAAKAKAAALSRYSGTVERVMKLPNGSYVVHVVTSKGEYHVTVSRDFKVTGAQQGGPGHGGPPAGMHPPAAAGKSGGPSS